ncbi:unnamed protein product, partial [Pleuronectes platessa]
GSRSTHVSQTSRTAANLSVARLQRLVSWWSKRSSLEYVWNSFRGIVAQTIARPLSESHRLAAASPRDLMMFSTVGVMNRPHVDAMSPARDFACIVGPGQTPLRAAATSEEEQLLPSRPYSLDDHVISPFLYWKVSPSMSPVGVVVQPWSSPSSSSSKDD